MSKALRLCATLVATLVFPLVASSASAATGAVSGTFKFWNRNGNFCPSANACVGSLYPQSLFDTTLPVANASVWITDGWFNKIGQGLTDGNGAFNVAWTASVKPEKVQAIIFPTQKDNRFWFANTAGTLISNTSGAFWTAASSSTASPQSIGVRVVGSQTSPDPYYNAYWAAERQWRTVQDLTSVQQMYFTNVEIRGFANDIPGFLGSLPTSGASGAQRRVQLDVNAGFAPQARVMHELGHIANYVANSFKYTMAFNWVQGATAPATQGGGWLFTTPEWGSAAFEEAFATHYGSITFWADNSATPTTCLAGQGATCYLSGAPATGTDIEATSYPFSTNNCSLAAANPEARWPLSAMRYFWDVFDNHNDGDGDTYSANQGQFFLHLSVLAAYSFGPGVNQNNEPWNDTLTSITEPDGRGCAAYEANFAAQSGNSTSLLRVDNCSPP